MGKIVIMTTHYMDEAEHLGDRVAIMSHGKLKTCGTPLFLKNKFSDAYLIEVTKMDQAADLQELTDILNTNLAKTGCDEPIRVSINEAGHELFTVPKAIDQQFFSLFREIDQRKSQLNIGDYLVRTSSLEEVFIQIGENEKKEIAATVNIDGPK